MLGNTEANNQMVSIFVAMPMYFLLLVKNDGGNGGIEI